MQTEPLVMLYQMHAYLCASNLIASCSCTADDNVTPSLARITYEVFTQPQHQAVNYVSLWGESKLVNHVNKAATHTKHIQAL